MKVSLLVGANPYVVITTEQRTLNVLIQSDKTVKASMIDRAKEMREQALRLLDRAALIEQASQQV